MKNELLRVQSMTLTIDNTTLLHNISLSIYQGELLGVFGLHSAAKTVLAKAISGFLPIPEGSIAYNDEVFYFKANTRRVPRQNEFFYISKQSMLIAERSIAENLVAIKSQHGGQLFYSARQARVSTQNLLDDAGLEVDAGQLAGTLDPQEQHIMQILKGVSIGAKLIILDDILNGYSDADYARLLKCIRQHPAITFVCVANKVLPIGPVFDRTVVMAQGHITGFVYQKEYDPHKIMQMATTQPPLMEDRFSSVAQSPLACQVEGLRVGQASLELALHKGEVVGLLADSNLHDGICRQFSQVPLCRMVIGGRIPASYEKAVRMGLALVPQESKQEYLDNYDFYGNLTFQSLPISHRLGFINKKLIRNIKESYDDRFTEDDKTVNKRFTRLKNILYRWIAVRPKVMVLVNITAGLDLYSKQSIFAILHEAATIGTAILFITSDLHEAAMLCDRCIQSVDHSEVSELHKNDLESVCNVDKVFQNT